MHGMPISHILPCGHAMSCWKRALAIPLLFLCLPMAGYGMTSGVFSGLVGEGQTGNGTAADMQAFFLGNGALLLTAKADGSFTGSLRLEGKTLAVKGKFDESGAATTLPVKLSGGRTAQVALNYQSTAPVSITGNVTTTSNATIAGATLPFEALAGTTAGSILRYTMALPAPGTSTNPTPLVSTDKRHLLAHGHG